MARWAYAAAEHPPSDTVRQHLLNAGLENLQLLIPLLPLFSVHEDEVDKIKEAFEKTKNNSELRFERDEIKKWLLFNSKHFMGELLSLANKVQDRSASDYVENEEALVAKPREEAEDDESGTESITHGPGPSLAESPDRSRPDQKNRGKYG